ncbi:hypothetical protein C2845_PM01G03470 [Panicum miliaceum]|uniref:Uncharacterized protein n=1 Tax=Panicum miliaceum TaxID=4540 RepID=A0A3L6TLW3_PANMI|nr:hypothetical protein C2845_PM01G03470 [Panicum miliaceum]
MAVAAKRFFFFHGEGSIGCRLFGGSCVKLVRWHQLPPGLDAGADLEPLLWDCPALRALDLSEFYRWMEDIGPALARHPAAAAALIELDLGLAGATDGSHAIELDLGLGTIAGSCPSLRKPVVPCVFNPWYVDFVGDDALLAIASSPPGVPSSRLAASGIVRAGIHQPTRGRGHYGGRADLLCCTPGG